MSREEAVSIIEERIHVTECVKSSYVDCVDIEALRLAIKALKQPEIIHCRDCKHRGEKPIADGRYWCEIHDTFMYYCSDAEGRCNSESKHMWNN